MEEAEILGSSADRVGAEQQETSARVFRDLREVHVKAPADVVYGVVASLGGQNGWYYANWLWRLRGAIDLLLGGIGCRRGRTNAEKIEVGDVIDCWRVEDHAPNTDLVLRGEMKVWGDAWLKFQIEPRGDSESVLSQTAVYRPWGMFGHFYWLSILPIHAMVFRGLSRSIGKRAEERWNAS